MLECGIMSSANDHWIDVGSIEAFDEGQPVCAQAEGKRIVVIQVEGVLHAIADVCPHAGKPLGQGELSGRVLRCPFHGFAYDVQSGRNVDWPHDEPGLKRYAVQQREGRVEVRLD